MHVLPFVMNLLGRAQEQTLKEDPQTIGCHGVPLKGLLVVVLVVLLQVSLFSLSDISSESDPSRTCKRTRRPQGIAGQTPLFSSFSSSSLSTDTARDIVLIGFRCTVATERERERAFLALKVVVLCFPLPFLTP